MMDRMALIMVKMGLMNGRMDLTDITLGRKAFMISKLALMTGRMVLLMVRTA